MADDAELLRLYLQERAEGAFAELVQRHIGMVYNAAARQLGEHGHLAPDVVQGVFLALAVKARELSSHPSLAGWLHATTRFKVSEALRVERRRLARETAGHAWHELMETGNTDEEWQRLRPVVDEALHELTDEDRDAVLLRYFDERPFAEIAQRLRISEAAANKRVERALERLRAPLEKRGVKSTAAALALVLAGQHSLAAPPGLATAVTGAVVSSGLPLAVAGGTVGIMSTKTIAAASIAMILAAGIATQQASAERQSAENLAAIEQQNRQLADTLQSRQARLAALPQPPANRGATASAARATATPVASPRGAGLASQEESAAFLKANPELRQALETNFRNRYQFEDAELMAAMGLSEAEQQQFVALRASGISSIIGEYRMSLRETPWAPGEYAQALKDLLGETRYQQFRESENSGFARDVVRQLTGSLYFTATPLTALQAREMARVIAEIRADPTMPKVGSVWVTAPEPLWARMIDDSKGVLGEPQLAVLREMQAELRFEKARGAASAAWRAKQAAEKK